MSRIEEALEKAEKMRKSSTQAPAPSKAAAATTTPASASGAGKTEAKRGPAPIPPVGGPIRAPHPLLISANDPKSQVAEEYRKLKSTLVKLTKSDPLKNLIMVTSSISGEGKSIISLNLAISLAQEYDHTVLLVDADLRKPSLHRYLGIEAKTGLAQCILEGAELSQALVKVGGKLTLLPAGREIFNPGELFSSQQVRELFTEIKNRYPDRYIIVDTPPILPFAETRSLSQIVDGVVFVVKEGFAPLPDINEAIDALKGSTVLGLIYNQASKQSVSSHYHSSYYYYAQQ